MPNENNTGLEDEAKFEIDLIEKTISTESANKYRVSAIIRRRSWLGAAGWVYYLERATSRSPRPGEFRLYGGRVEYTTPEQSKENTTTAAIMRELNEEIGEYKVESSDKPTFGAGQFDIFASIYGKAENGELMAVDIFRLEEDKVRRRMGFWIRKNQRDKKAALNKKMLALQHESAQIRPDSQKIAKLKKEIGELKECVEAGPPVKVRDFHGLWFRFGLGWHGLRLDWSRLSPLAAYALMMDRRVRTSRRR